MAENRSTTGEGMTFRRVSGPGTPCSLSMRHCTLVTAGTLACDRRLAGPGSSGTPRPGIRMAGVGFRRPGVVDVEAEYAPRHAPSGAVCDRGWRDLLAPVAPRNAGPRRNWWPAIAALRDHVRPLGCRPGVTAPVTGVLGSVVGSVTEPVTSTTPTVAQVAASTNQATPTASAGSASQPTAPPSQASPGASGASNPTATSPVASPTSAATPTVSVTGRSGTSRSLHLRSTAMPNSSAAAPAVAATSMRRPRPPRTATSAAGKTAQAPPRQEMQSQRRHPVGAAKPIALSPTFCRPLAECPDGWKTSCSRPD